MARPSKWDLKIILVDEAVYVTWNGPTKVASWLVVSFTADKTSLV